MRAVFSDEGVLEIYPDNSADKIALRAWDALHPVRTIHEGVQNPMPVRPASAVIIYNETNKGA